MCRWGRGVNGSAAIEPWAVSTEDVSFRLRSTRPSWSRRRCSCWRTARGGRLLVLSAFRRGSGGMTSTVSVASGAWPWRTTRLGRDGVATPQRRIGAVERGQPPRRRVVIDANA